jgi:AmiR/NasT family two-component response regulator
MGAPPLDPEDLAVLVARLMEAETKAQNLAEAQLSNRRIGMAMGILMASLKVTEENAFDLLRRTSSHRNVKLRELAEEVILTGRLEPK